MNIIIHLPIVLYEVYSIIIFFLRNSSTQNFNFTKSQHSYIKKKISSMINEVMCLISLKSSHYNNCQIFHVVNDNAVFFIVVNNKYVGNTYNNLYNYRY